MSFILPERVEMFIKKIDEVSSLDEIFDVLFTGLNTIGFEKFSYWMMFAPDGTKKTMYITNFSNDWRKHYRSNAYASDDLIGNHSKITLTPFIWSDLQKSYSLTKRQKIIFDEGAEAGLSGGATVPIHGPGMARAAFSVANSMDEKEFEKFFLNYRHEVHLMATYAHEKVIALNLHKPLKGEVVLTPRETEIMVWISKGKSRWEVAAILGISEDTVKTHLENVRRKLKASNTTHAIAIALLHGLILQ